MMKSVIIFALLLAAASAVPIDASAAEEIHREKEAALQENAKVNGRTMDLSGFPDMPSKSNLTALIRYLVQLEVNKTVAALAAIKDVTGFGPSTSPPSFTYWLPGMGNQFAPATPPSAAPSMPYRLPYQQAWIVKIVRYIRCFEIFGSSAGFVGIPLVLEEYLSVMNCYTQSAAAEYVRPIYSSYWTPYIRAESMPNDGGYQLAARELRTLKEQYPDVLDAGTNGASEPSVTLTFRNFLSLLGSLQKGSSDQSILG